MTNAPLLFILEEKGVFAVKRLLCLLLCALCLCACGKAETPAPTEPTQPAEKLVPKPLTWADIDAIPIATADMTEEELRQICIDYFRLQLSFQWTPKEPLSYMINTYEEPNAFEVGPVYAGCPYNCPGSFGNLYVIMDYYDPQTGLLDNSGIDQQTFADRIGNHCSSGPLWAWNRVVNSVAAYTNDCMTPFYGYIPVGDFLCAPTCWTEGTATIPVCQENGETVMYEAYAQAKPADLMINHTGESTVTHVRMVAAEPVVVRNPDGSIDPKNSYISTIHQHGDASEQTVDGYRVIAQGGIDEPISFEGMYKVGYLIFTFGEFLGEDPVEPAQPLATFGSYETIDLRQLQNGNISCNYFISQLTATLTDADGQQVYTGTYYPIYGADTRIRFHTAQVAADPKIKALAETSDLTLTLDCRLGTGQLLTVYSGPLAE